MKAVLELNEKLVLERRESLFKKINYNPEMAAKAWKAIEGVLEDRTDIDATTVRAEAWNRKK